jgi:hypothetical protein
MNTYRKLLDGSWGVVCDDPPPPPGSQVIVTRRDGSTTTETLGEKVASFRSKLDGRDKTIYVIVKRGRGQSRPSQTTSHSPRSESAPQVQNLDID